MCAPAAARSCGRSRAIVACSVPTVRFRVRRFRRSVRARQAQLHVARDRFMPIDALQASKDWLGSARSNALAWWLPQAAIVAGLIAPVPIRTVIWIIALIWMGTACLMNARRCGRTHCRYTGLIILRWSRRCSYSAQGSLPSGFVDCLCWACLFSPEARSFGGRPNGRGASFPESDTSVVRLSRLWEIIAFRGCGRMRLLVLLRQFVADSKPSSDSCNTFDTARIGIGLR